jgi:transposase
MIRIDAMWLAVEPVDMRAGVERLLARVVQVFGAARAHHGYLCQRTIEPDQAPGA